MATDLNSVSAKRWQDQLILLLGLWFFITPWVFGYPIPSVQAWTAFISGAVIALLAAFDLYEMKALMRENLPAGRAVVCRDADVWAGGKLRWACSGGAGAPLVVKVGWRGKNPDGTPHKDRAGEYAPGVALTVGAP